MKAEICSGLYLCPFTSTLYSVPIFRFISRIVSWGLTDICLFAFSPTITLPSGMNATTEGNIFPPTASPSWLGIEMAPDPS